MVECLKPSMHPCIQSLAPKHDDFIIAISADEGGVIGEEIVEFLKGKRAFKIR